MVCFVFRGIPVASLLLALSSPAAITNAQLHSHRRINVAPGQSIADEIQNAHASGNSLPHFSLLAERAGSETNYEVHVREATSAVTSETTTSVGGGASRKVKADNVATILVGDDDESGMFAIIAVEKIGGTTNGIVQKNGEKVKITQNGRGQKAWAEAAQDFVPPAWACGVGANEMVNARTGVDRLLLEDVEDADHDHSDQDHSDHDHYSNHHHTHDFEPSKTEEALADLQHSLRGSDVRIGKRRRVQGASYNYWVDVYVEIDYALCNDNGETCANGIGTNTINYGQF